MPVAIVTGGNTGIGRATVVALARAGFDLGVTWERDEDRARSTLAEVRALGRRCELAHLDLSAPQEGATTVDALSRALEGLDVLVNNAAAETSAPFLDVDLATWRRVLDIDLTGPFVCAQAAARRMAAQGRGGAIVNVTSVHEHIPLRGSGPYTAAKHGLGGLTKLMALELGEHGIRVNSVAPGRIATRMTGQEDEEPVRTSVPLGRAGHAEEVAAVVAWLASPEASYVTGSTYAVDGGLMLRAAEFQ